MRISSIISKIRYDVNKHSPEKLKMRKKVNDNNKYINQYIKTSNDKDQGSF